MATTLTFTKKGDWWVSNPMTGSKNYTVRLSFKDEGKCNILVETTILSAADPWAPEANIVYNGKEWEKNINGVAVHQKVRICTTKELKSGLSIGY